MAIHGFTADGFDAVRAAFRQNFDDGDVGASVAASVDGEMVVDLWGGTATFDSGPGQWQEDTIINVWSTTKTMAALCCLVLADRGLLDLRAPIASYWPEFAAGGKENVAASHVLSHSAGLPGWQEPITDDDFVDHHKLSTLLAAQEPWWEPGTASGYHAITQGYLLGEIVRRVDGRSLGTFFADEIADPLDADFHIGTGPEHDDRVAHVIPPPEPLTADTDDTQSIPYRAMANPGLGAEFSSTTAWRRAEVPAVGGHGNARSVARVHTATANGGTAFGQRILSPDGVRRIFETQVEGTDLVLQLPLRLGMGFGLPTVGTPFPSPNTCFWGGWGGSLAIIDTDLRISFSYVMNKMGDGTFGDMRGYNLLVALYGALSTTV